MVTRNPAGVGVMFPNLFAAPNWDSMGEAPDESPLFDMVIPRETGPRKF
jgi:hypothetical protein